MPEDKLVESTPGVLMPRANANLNDPNASKADNRDDKDEEKGGKPVENGQAAGASDSKEVKQSSFDASDEADTSRFQVEQIFHSQICAFVSA